MLTLDEARGLLKEEITQRTEEGCRTEGFAKKAEAIGDAMQAEELYGALMALPDSETYAEPSDIARIRDLRPKGPRRLAGAPRDEALLDRILGGWLGRCAGCQLGKPVEGWPKEKIRRYLEGAGAFPLAGYFPAKSVDGAGKEWNLPAVQSCREAIKRAERDDDQDYTVLGLHILERHGPDFTTDQVGEEWLYRLPYWQTYTAERQAYRNLVEGYRYPESALRWNPYREWIGAQIRADAFGFAAPGMPEKAAEMAFRDAALSHVKNGIYGEMFVAAALAAAFCSDTAESCIRTALTEIPARGRFAETVGDCLGWWKEGLDWEAAWGRVNAKFGRYHGVHTLNNAAVVLLALLYGEGDFGKTICLAVEGGWDTDCNGATAGSIAGVLAGAARLPREWTAPLNDTLLSAIFGFGESRISDLARRTFLLAQKIAP